MTINRSSDLLALRPDQLAARHDPAELLDLLRQRREDMPLSAAQSLDYALAHWVTEALSRADDPQSVVLLDSLCAVAARRAGPDGAALAARWTAWRPLLENRRLALEGRAAGRAQRLLQFEPICQALRAAHAPMPQVALAAALGLTAARMSQLLAVMEESGVVRRQRVGREMQVSLVAEAAPRARPAAAATAATRPIAVFSCNRQAA